MGGRPSGVPGHAMIPIWIDEDMTSETNPLDRVVKGKLAALLPEEKLEQAFLEALFKKQRLLIVLDRLSERSGTTLHYIATVYRSLRPEALLITARMPLNIEGATPVILYPQSLNQETLLHFMTSLLKLGTGEPDTPSTVSLDDQLALGKKLADLYRTATHADGSGTRILPLPVRLFVEEAKNNIRAGRPLDLPLSVPGVYLRYLEQVNPQEPTSRNFMTHAEMLRAATVLAKLALGRDFIPKEFDAASAAAALRDAGWDNPQLLDPLQRLVDNGILIEKDPLISRHLRFALDPIADNLAAAAYVREAAKDAIQLTDLRAKAAKAPGFLNAIDLVSRPDDAPDPLHS